METKLPFVITPQPDDTTCGPSCLHAIYRYYGEDVPLEQIIAEVPSLPGGGTLAVHLACHALRKGYRATLYTYNLQVFDPTWFRNPTPDQLAGKLREQAIHKRGDRFQFATPAYIEMLEMGGQIRLEDLTPALIRGYLRRDTPVICGLSSTYLYQCARERWDDAWIDDDVRGVPEGHFVVLCGYDRESREALVADPYIRNPVAAGRLYEIGINRILIAILLGVITYDANVLVIRPAS